MNLRDVEWTEDGYNSDRLNEVACIARDTGQEWALEEVRRRMRPFVMSMLQKYEWLGGDRGYRLDQQEDLKSAVWEGVWVALHKFDESKGTKFSSYAYFWMRNSLQEWMAKNSRALPVSRSAWAHAQQIRERWEADNPDRPIETASDKELADVSIYDYRKESRTRTVEHAGDIFRALRNPQVFDPEFDSLGQTTSAESEFMDATFDADADALATLDEMMAAPTPDAAMTMALDFCDRHGLPYDIADRMMEAET